MWLFPDLFGIDQNLHESMFFFCFKDMPTKTATGTIAVNVEDTNDNCPRLTSRYQFLCSDTKVRVLLSYHSETD